jgi:hypothetical protein
MFNHGAAPYIIQLILPAGTAQQHIVVFYA